MSLVAYGTACTWWGPVTECNVYSAPSHPVDALCCPYCHAPVKLAEHAMWYVAMTIAASSRVATGIAGAQRYERFVQWLHGRCIVNPRKHEILYPHSPSTAHEAAWQLFNEQVPS